MSAGDLGRGYGALHFSGRDDRVGQLAHVSLVDGKGNAYVGLRAGNRAYGGKNNTYVGTAAGANAFAHDAVFLGLDAGQYATHVQNCVFIGMKAGELARHVDATCLVGAYAGRKMVRAANNAVFGHGAGAELTSGSRNCLFGSYAGYSQYSGSDNTCIGHRSGYKNKLGSNNVYIGTDSGFAASVGFENTCIGVGSGEFLSSGTKNVLTGYRAGRSIDTASNCIAIGTQAMEFFKDGDTNTCLGAGTARQFTGTNNTILGGYSAANAMGNFNTIVGARSMNRRNGARVKMGNCVIVGENIQFDIAIRAATLGVGAALLNGGASLDGATSTLSLDGGGQALFALATAFVGTPLLPTEHATSVGTDAQPLFLDATQAGTYEISWGGSLVGANSLMLRPRQVAIVITLAGDGSAAVEVFVFGAAAGAWTIPVTGDQLQLYAQHASSQLRVRVGPAGVPLTSVVVDVGPFEEPVLQIIDPVQTVPGMPTRVRLQLQGAPDLVPGGQVRIVDAAVPQLNGTFEIAEITVSASTTSAVLEVGVAVPVDGGSLGLSVRAFGARTVTQATAVVGLAAAGDGETVSCLLPDLRGYLPVGAAAFALGVVARVVDATGGQISLRFPPGILPAAAAQQGSAVPLGVVRAATFLPPTRGLAIAATGVSKRVQNIQVGYNQRADAGVVTNVFSAPTADDGVVLVGAVGVNASARTFTYSGAEYAAAEYDIGDFNATLEVDVAFDFPTGVDGGAFGVDWTGAFSLACIAFPSGDGLDVTLSHEGSAIASVLGESVSGRRTDVAVRTTEYVAGVMTVLPSALPVDVAWVRDGATLVWAGLSVVQDQPSGSLRIEVSLHGAQTTDPLVLPALSSDAYDRHRVVRVSVSLADAPSMPPEGTRLAVWASGGPTVARGVRVLNTRFLDTPQFTNCVYLGSNFTVTDPEDRANAFVVSVGPNKVFRATPDGVSLFGTTTRASLMKLDGLSYDVGAVPADTHTLVIRGTKPAGDYASAGKALSVLGDARFAADVSISGGLSAAGPIALQPPSTIDAATYTVAATDSSLRFTTTDVTLTLPAAASSPGRILFLSTITANRVMSASSSVIPLGSTAAGTAILPAGVAGKFAMLQSDGTNWVTLMSN